MRPNKALKLDLMSPEVLRALHRSLGMALAPRAGRLKVLWLPKVVAEDPTPYCTV